MIRKVEHIFTPKTPHFVGDGFRVHNFIPGYPQLNQKRMDPFIMLDYNSKYVFPPSEIPKGVGVHPHKGFETVTIAYHGRVEHGDSSGGGGVIGEGDVQWMTAGKGVLHKEFHETEWSKEGGVFQMIQLWVNLPAKDKVSPPKYQSVSKETIKSHALEDGLGIVEVIAGNYKDVEGSASTFTPIAMYNLKAQKGAHASFNIPASYNTFILVVEGNVIVNGSDEIKVNHMALLANEGEEFTLDVKEDAVVFIAGGEPINEPIVHYGPFVMNTEQEIEDAIQDFQIGKFGNLN